MRFLQRSFRILQVPAKILEDPSGPCKDSLGSFRSLQRSPRVLQVPAWKSLQRSSRVYKDPLGSCKDPSGPYKDWSGFYKDPLGSYKDGSYPCNNLLGSCSNRFLQGFFRSQQRSPRFLFSFIKNL